MENQHELIWIYTRKMAIYLQLKGHILIGVKDDIKSKERKIYFFVNTPTLKENMNKYNSDQEFHYYYKNVSKGEDFISDHKHQQQAANIR